MTFMKFANPSNRHLLLGLVGVGLLNGVLCLVLVLRENTNGTRIATVGRELDSTRDRHQHELEGLQTDLTKTQGELAKTAQQLASTQSDLNRAQKVLDAYQGKPWLAKSGKQPPWEQQVQGLSTRLGGLKKSLMDLLKPKVADPGKEKSPEKRDSR